MKHRTPVRRTDTLTRANLTAALLAASGPLDAGQLVDIVVGTVTRPDKRRKDLAARVGRLLGPMPPLGYTVDSQR
jgi:hypothetical protein